MRLTILEHAGQPLRPPVSKDFSAPGATIGRGADNHLVLLDDTRQISRLQASVRIDDSGTYLANLSTVCPVEVNDAALTGDQPRRLQEGDQVRIGLYLLRVGDQQAADASASPLPPVAEVEDFIKIAPVNIAPVNVDPAPSAPAAPVASDDAFWDKLMSDFTPAPSTRLFAATAPVAAPLAVAQAPAPEMLLPDDALATLSNPSVDPLDFFANPGAESPSKLFADSASALPDTSTALLELAQQDQAACAPFDTGSLFGREMAGGAQAHPAPAQFAAGFAPPPVRTAPQPAYYEPAPPTPAAAFANAAPLTQDAASMVAAFLDGAGFTPNEGTLTEAHFHQAGRLLSKLVGGSMNLLTSRTIIKREVKAELTMMLDKENNPLKLLPDAKTVLKQMFGPPFSGFMTSERAIDDTFHDLQAHQMGMLAGMRAALNQLLRNFSPEVVDKQMGADVWYDRLMPKGRDGRAWVRYRALHQAAVTAVEEDFHTVFGQVFLSAYDAEVELYRAQRMQQAC